MTRILIVEDDETLRIALGKLLEHEGFAVTLADGGVEGLRQLFTNPPDCVILDLLMPGVSGIDFLDIKMQDPRVSEVPTVIFTGADVDPARLQGATIYVSKPVGNIKEICQAVIEVMRHARETLPPERPQNE